MHCQAKISHGGKLEQCTQMCHYDYTLCTYHIYEAKQKNNWLNKINQLIREYEIENKHSKNNSDSKTKNIIDELKNLSEKLLSNDTSLKEIQDNFHEIISKDDSLDIYKLQDHKQPKKIGEGTYGKVFHPPLKCISNKYKKFENLNFVMKVIPKDGIEAVETELESAALLSKIEDSEKYFILLTQDCCDVKIDSEGKETALGYFMPFGGQTIDFIDKEDLSVEKLFIWYEHLIKGIKILIENNVIHCDIKALNIVIGDKPNSLPKIIDFGIALIEPEIYKMKQSNCVYVYWPLHFNALYAKNLEELYECYEDAYVEMRYVRTHKKVKNVDVDPCSFYYHMVQQNKYSKKKLRQKKSQNNNNQDEVEAKTEKKEIDFISEYQFKYRFKIDTIMVSNVLNELLLFMFDTIKKEELLFYRAFKNLINHATDLNMEKCYDVDQILEGCAELRLEFNSNLKNI